MSHGFKRAASYGAFFTLIYTPTILVFYFAWTTEFEPMKGYETLRKIAWFLFLPLLSKYIIQLFLAPWYPAVERSRRKRRLMKLPTVSVLVPAWNEEVGIIKTVQSILGTRYPFLEIVIINDGSTDNTHNVVTEYLAKHQNTPTKLTYLKLKNGGKAKALNRALQIASGEIVITIDADSVMAKGCIRNMVKHFADPEVASVAGNVFIGNKKKILGLIQQLEYNYGFYFKRADAIMNAVYIVGGAAAAYRKDLIVKLGGFDEQIITEDIELSTKLQFYGHKIRFASDAVVYTEGPSDFAGLCKQRLRWKYGRLVTFFKYRGLFFSFRRHHNFFLSYFVLPIALFSEILLFFEGVTLVIFYYYTLVTNDYKPLAFVIVAITTIVSFQVLSDKSFKYHKNLLLLAPGAWIIFYIMDLVEYQALIRSIKKLVTKQELVWQKWARTGVFVDEK